MDITKANFIQSLQLTNTNISQRLSIYLHQLCAITVWYFNVKSRQVNHVYVSDRHNNYCASTAQNNSTIT